MKFAGSSRMTRLWIAIIASGITAAASAQLPRGVFAGERVKYKVRYNLYFNIPVGEFVFYTDTSAPSILGRPTVHIRAVGYSYPFYDAFFMVRDTYGTFLDRRTGLPVVFYRKVHEGDYHFSEFVTFLRHKGKAYNRDKRRTTPIPAGVHDVVSAIFYARSIDYEHLRPGDSIMFPLYIDDSVYHVGVIYQGKETVRVRGERVQAYRLVPILIVDRVFKSEEDMTIWLSADDRRLPVKIRSGISVGAVEAVLDEFHR